MSVNLNLPAAQVDLGSATYANLRANLQANILKSHGRPNQRHVFLEFTGTAAAVKTWIKTHVAPKVTTAEAQHQQALARTANPAADGGLVTGFFLSATGYAKLSLALGGFDDEFFRKGMKVKRGSGHDSLPATWEQPYRGKVDAMVAFGDASEAAVLAAVAALTATLGGIATRLTVEAGRALVTADGVNREHFGYADGISQPLFDRSELPPADQTKWDASAPLRLVLAADPFATGTVDAFGSYFVYRKLGQRVDHFDSRVLALAAAIPTNPELAGAMAVGRFKDGTPVVDFDTAQGPTKANGFKFNEVGDKFRCPVHAHIRKANPRKGIILVNERDKRLARRAVPYGKPVFPIAGGGFQDPSLAAERGLLFMCFQRSIEDQFHFIQKRWVDDKNFPTLASKVGDDPVIGQNPGKEQRWPKVWGDKNAGKVDFNFEAAVTLKGGEYFFAPSKAFLDGLG